MKNKVPTSQIMTQIRRPWPLCLSLVGLLAALATSPHCGATEPGNQTNEIRAVRLTQSHLFLGPTQLTMSPTHVRLDSTGQMHFTLVSSAPDWTVTVFRNDDKVITHESLKQFAFSGLVPELVLSFRTRGLYSTLRPVSFKYSGFDARRVSNNGFQLEYLPLANLTAPQVETIMYSAYRLPTQGGLALRYVSIADGRDWITGQQMAGQKEVELTTSRAETVLVPEDFFTPPRGYRPVKDMQEVVVGNQTRAQSADFQNLLEPKSPKNKASGKP